MRSMRIGCHSTPAWDIAWTLPWHRIGRPGTPNLASAPRSMSPPHLDPFGGYMWEHIAYLDGLASGNRLLQRERRNTPKPTEEVSLCFSLFDTKQVHDLASRHVAYRGYSNGPGYDSASKFHVDRYSKQLEDMKFPLRSPTRCAI